MSSSSCDQLFSHSSTLSRDSGDVASSSKYGEMSDQPASAKASGEAGSEKVCTATEVSVLGKVESWRVAAGQTSGAAVIPSEARNDRDLPQQPIPVPPAQAKCGPSHQGHLVLAVPLRPDLADSIEVHDSRAVDARELRWVELPLEVGHRDSHLVRS